MISDIDLSQIAYEDEAIKETLTKILSDKYKHDVRIAGFSKVEIRNWEHCIVSRLYIQLYSCETETVIFKQFNPKTNDKNIVILQEVIGPILSGKNIAPEFYGTVRDVDKGRYWLFMEDLGENLVKGRYDWVQENIEHCLRFIEKFAKIHLLFLENEKLLREHIYYPDIPHSRSEWYNSCNFAIRGALNNVNKVMQTGYFPWIEEIIDDFSRILEPCLPIVDSLMPYLSFSWTHADKSPEENMIIGCEGKKPIYYFLDWDDICFVPVLDDLAGFLDFGRDLKDELTIVSRYWECVQSSCLLPFSKKECLAIYRYFKLISAIRCIHYQAGRLAQKNFRDDWHEQVLKRVLPASIKLSKELEII